MDRRNKTLKEYNLIDIGEIMTQKVNYDIQSFNYEIKCQLCVIIMTNLLINNLDFLLVISTCHNFDFLS